MKTSLSLQLTRALRLRGTFLAVIAGCFAACLAATHAASLSLQPLVQPGKWPTWPRGDEALDVAVASNYAFVALGSGGLAVIDVSDPTNCVQVGGYATSGYVFAVAVSGNYAYMVDWEAGLQ